MLLMLGSGCSVVQAAERAGGGPDDAWEALLLRPLPRSELLLHLNLTVETDAVDPRHLELFARPLAELALGSGLAEAHLTLSSGRWLDAWGSQPEPAPPGLELWGWFAPVAPVGPRWDAVRTSLAALVCASAAGRSGGVEEVSWGGAEGEEGRGWEGSSEHAELLSVASPRLAPRSSRDALAALAALASADAVLAARDGSGSGAAVLRHVERPRGGSVCTESLAAWTALWPCSDAAGVAAVLATDAPMRARVRASRYRSIQLHLTARCADGAGANAADTAAAGGGGGPCIPRLRAQLSLTAVVPKAEATEGAALVGSAVGACPLALTSSLRLQLPRGTAVRVAPAQSSVGRRQPTVAPSAVGDLGNARTLLASTAPTRLSDAAAHGEGWTAAEWSLHAGSPLELRWAAVTSEGVPASWASAPHGGEAAGGVEVVVGGRPLRARRLAARADDLSGVLVYELRSGASPLHVRCFDTVPGWMQPRWHTLRAHLRATRNGSADEAADDTALVAARAVPDPPLLLRQLRIAPAGTHRASHRASWEATLPAAATLVVTARYTVAVLPVDDLPADASRGLDLPAVAFGYRQAGSAAEDDVEAAETWLFTDTTLVPLPLPDLSMPYNVISVTSTLVALAVGAMFNLFTARRDDDAPSAARARDRRKRAGRAFE